MAAAGKSTNTKGKTSASAAKKSTTGKTTSTGKSTTTRKTASATTRKSTTTRKTASKQAAQKEIYDFPIRREIGVLIGMAAAVILFVSSFEVGGNNLGWLRQINFGLFGWFGYVSALVVAFLTAFVAANLDHFGRKPKIKCAGVALLVVTVCGFLQDIQTTFFDYTLTPEQYYQYGYERGGGGLIGGLILRPLYPFLGKVGSGILFFFLGLIALMIITEISLQDVYDWFVRMNNRHKAQVQLRKEQEAKYIEETRARRLREQEAAKKQSAASADSRTTAAERRRVANVDLKKSAGWRESAPENVPVKESSVRAAEPAAEAEPPVSHEKRTHTLYEWISRRRKEEEHQEAAAAQTAQPTDENVIQAPSDGGSRRRQQLKPFPEGEFVQSKLKMPGQDVADAAAALMAAEAGTFVKKEETETVYDPYADFPEKPADKYSNTAYDSKEAVQNSTIVVETASGKKIVVERDTVAAPVKKRTIAYTGPKESEDGEAQAAAEAPKKPSKPYAAPPLHLLKRTQPGTKEKNRDMELAETAALLEQTFRDFGVGVEVTDYSCGPTVTRYELTPAQGVKVSRITALTDDVKLKLAATDIRIEAPIPGKSAVGIEVPNKENSTVLLGDLFANTEFQKHPSKVAFAVGKDIAGKVIVFDIARMPHLLIAGATGSGKSVCINTLIMSILYKATPDEVKLIMIDPKVVELSVYNGIPHLAKPVVTDAKKASSVLNWAVAEMTRRYHKFAETNTRDISSYNQHIAADAELSEEEKKTARLPQMVIIVDELADLMMVAPGEVEDAICRLAQMARAAGIHLVLATQRPSVNVITGLIKANVPSRIAFSVSSGVDSRTIIDMNGAEKLLGKGDMLFYPFGYNKPVRVQGAFVSDEEVASVVEALTKANDSYVPSTEITESFEEEPAEEEQTALDVDEYFVQAGYFLIEKEKGSIGMLQRIFRIGFNRAARIMDQLAEYGVVGEEDGTKPRAILMTKAQFDAFLEERGMSAGDNLL